MRLVFACLLLATSACRAAPMAKGADVGWLQQMEASGFTFRDRNGKPADCLQILKDCGIDTIRLRVWVNPSQDPRRGHCSRDEVAAMAERARGMGFRILINFHYSDSWADPAKQTKSAAWARHDFEQLRKDVYEHTADVMKALKERGVTPEWVQIGNEIPGGILWPDGRSSTSPGNLVKLINEDHRAVKASDSRIKVILHLNRGNDNAHFRWFFDLMEKHGAEYDVIGFSYYPFWLPGKPDYTRAANTRAILGAVIEKNASGSREPRPRRHLLGAADRGGLESIQTQLLERRWTPDRGTGGFS